MTHLTQAQQQEAMELLRVFLDTQLFAWDGMYVSCAYCNKRACSPDEIEHTKRCAARRAQALLAAIESEASE
jgi:hypothetical protein